MSLPRPLNNAVMINGLVNYFVPPSLRVPIDAFHRARTLVILALLGAGFMFGFAVVRFLWQGWHPYPLLVSLTVITCLAALFTQKLTGSTYAAGTMLSLGGSILFGAMMLVDGRLASPTITALPLFPLLGIFFAGNTVGLISGLLVSTVVLVSTFAPAHLMAAISPPQLDRASLDILFAASILGVTAVFGAIAAALLDWQHAAREELLRANDAKDDFLSGMSHELRTPLNSIVGFAQVLQKEYLGKLNAEQQEQLTLIRNGGDQLTRLVDNLLDLTYIESSQLPLQVQPVALRTLIRECSAAVEDELRNSELTLSVEFAPDVPDLIPADINRLRQILINLLSNAIKFTPRHGSINMHISKDNDRINVAVADTGPGIEEPYQSLIFEKFYQVQSNREDARRGSGLGLYISRQLVAMMGGSLELDKHYTEGCRMLMCLPVSNRLSA